MVLVAREMLDPKFFVGHCKHRRAELGNVWHVGALDVAAIPAWINQLPSTIDVDSIPSMACVVWW